MPSELFVGALRQLGRELEPVVVTRDEATGAVVVQAGERTKSIPLAEVQGPWDVGARLTEVFAFLGSELRDHGPVDLRRWEIAATRGLIEGLNDDEWIDAGGGRTGGTPVQATREHVDFAPVESRALRPTPRWMETAPPTSMASGAADAATGAIAPGHSMAS